MKKKLNNNVISTSVLCLILAVCFFMTFMLIDSIIMGSGYVVLDNTTTEITVNLQSDVMKNKEQLDIIAELIAGHKEITTEMVKEQLVSLENTGSISTLVALMSDNSLIYRNEDEQINLNLLFRTESEKVPYLSEEGQYFEGNDNSYKYWAVPIQKDDDIIGILYGFSDLSGFSLNYEVDAFDGLSNIFIVDMDDGNIIIDTKDSNLGNVNSKGQNNQLYEYIAENSEAMKGNIGTIEGCKDEKGEEYLARYMPLGIDDYTVILTVPEEELFAEANRIRTVIIVIAIAEVISILFYVISNLRRINKAYDSNKRQLEQSVYMFEVQQILFDAHKDTTLISTALSKVTEMTGAETALLIALDGTSVNEYYSWSKNNKMQDDNDFNGKNLSKYFPGICSMLTRGKSVVYYSPDRSNILDETDVVYLKKYDVNNFMLVPVLDSSNHLTGLLASINMETRWDNAILLECVARNFMMALSNLGSFRLIQKMGTTDALTGLSNRNSYQKALVEYATVKDTSLCCVYMDANGLHELNNSLGHKAGDDMLKYVGDRLKKYFSEYDMYRIGGDEFVVVCIGISEVQVGEKIAAFKHDIEKENYFVSIGMAWHKPDVKIEKTIALAEGRMYEDKRLYYRNRGDESKARI